MAYKNSLMGAGVIVHSVKCSLYKHEDLSSVLGTYTKRWVQSVDYTVGRWTQMELWDSLAGQPRQWMHSGFSERRCHNTIGKDQLKKISEARTCMHTLTMHTKLSDNQPKYLQDLKGIFYSWTCIASTNSNTFSFSRGEPHGTRISFVLNKWEEPQESVGFSKTFQQPGVISVLGTGFFPCTGRKALLHRVPETILHHSFMLSDVRIAFGSLWPNA